MTDKSMDLNSCANIDKIRADDNNTVIRRLGHIKKVPYELYRIRKETNQSKEKSTVPSSSTVTPSTSVSPPTITTTTTTTTTATATTASKLSSMTKKLPSEKRSHVIETSTFSINSWAC